MADFKIDGHMKVKKLKELFKKEFKGTLRVYKGQRLANDKATLASIRYGDKKMCSDFTCRASRTVGKFCEELFNDFGIKVKVATPDDWDVVLDGITLATLKSLPNNLTRKEMEKYLSYQQSSNIKDVSKVGKEKSCDVLGECTIDEKGGNLGLLCENGKIAIPYDYDFIEDLYNYTNLVVVGRDNKKGVYSIKNT